MTTHPRPAMDTNRHLISKIDFQPQAFTKLTPESRARFLSEIAILLREPVRAYEHVRVQRDRVLDVFLGVLGGMTQRWDPGIDYHGGEARQVLHGDLEVRLDGRDPIRMPEFRSGYFRGGRGLGLVYPSGEGLGMRYNLTALLPGPVRTTVAARRH